MVFKVNYCDHCGTKLELAATIASWEVCRKILNHLEISFNEFEVAMPQGPPEQYCFDQVYEEY